MQALFCGQSRVVPPYAERVARRFRRLTKYNVPRLAERVKRGDCSNSQGSRARCHEIMGRPLPDGYPVGVNGPDARWGLPAEPRMALRIAACYGRENFTVSLAPGASMVFPFRWLHNLLAPFAHRRTRPARRQG